MINHLGKFLVLIHVTMSVAGMMWAIMTVLQARDYGWAEPYREVTERTKDGGEKSAVRYASVYDKSEAAVVAAARMRDHNYIYVKPAIDALQATMPHLPNNHLHYRQELEKLKTGEGPLVVRRLAKGGVDTLDKAIVGKPVLEDEDQAIKSITQSYKTYEKDYQKLFKEIDAVDAEVRDIVTKTKQITMEMTGTDDTNKYIKPGLYQLTDLEFKAQGLIKTEVDDIKPNWSKAVEQARLFQYRRVDLEASLEKLKTQPPAPKKKPL
ncbi:MAG: hypothetical protein EXS16_14575 [Gemmataceae bacterium]|nr:hypothetical protein [Gemmataceae bacterium]